MNNNIRQLQKEKERKLKNLSIKEVKTYIERNVAYYYSHYLNFDLIYGTSDDTINELTKEAERFQQSFNNNLDLIIKSIKDDYLMDSQVKHANINYIIAVLFQSINENIMLNRGKETEQLHNLLNNVQGSIMYQNTINGLIIGFVSYVNVTYSLLNHCKSSLLSMYDLLFLHGIDDKIFNVLNSSFKQLFMEFHMNYVCCKRYFLEDVIDDTGIIFEDTIESNETKFLYNEAVERLSEIDDEFKLLVKDNDLFSFPKMYLKDYPIDNFIVYDLKRFDVDYVIQDDIINILDDVDVCDEYKQLEEFEKKNNVSILFDIETIDESTVETTGKTIHIDNADINDENIDELEEMLL